MLLPLAMCFSMNLHFFPGKVTICIDSSLHDLQLQLHWVAQQDILMLKKDKGFSSSVRGSFFLTFLTTDCRCLCLSLFSWLSLLWSMLGMSMSPSFPMPLPFSIFSLQQMTCLCEISTLWEPSSHNSYFTQNDLLIKYAPGYFVAT